MNMSGLWALTLGAPILVSCHKSSAMETPAAPPPDPASVQYPDAERGDTVDNLHGVEIPDPYRWLEDPRSDETRRWIEAQNDLTRQWLGEVSQRDAIRARLDELWSYEQYSIPVQAGDRLFYTRNPGTWDHAALYMADGDEATLLLDPNELSEDGTVSLAGWSVSSDGRWLAYGLSDGGSDWTTWRVIDVDKGEELDEVLEWVKFSGASWSEDRQGFYYGRYPAPENPLEEVVVGQELYYHALGTPQDEDRLVYHRPDEPEWGFAGMETEDGRWLVIHIWQGTDDKNRIYLKDLSQGPDAPVTALLDDFDASYHLVGSEGSRFWFLTNLEAPRRRLVAMDVTSPGEGFTEVIPEAEETLASVSYLGGRFFASYTRDAHSLVRVHGADGEAQGTVELPGLGSASGFGGRQDSTRTFFGFSSFARPTTIYSLDVQSGESEVFRTPNILFDPDDYVTRQVFFASPDGTRVPMFISHRADVTPDEDTPTLLYGYGGFNISLTPRFRPTALQWMEMGGVYAVANTRGGGEYGREWHLAGTRERKQNTFDDFIAAAEWLMEQGLTRPERLAIQGGSNGGLLVAACMLQRPDLFAAVLPAVGVLDMLRYHRFTIGWAWASDYGTADEPEMFEVLRGYSPLHNVAPGTTYPATFITTGDHDDRVVPAHSFKFAAALQAAQAGPMPVLIRVETRAGHGRGKSRSLVLDEAADTWAFLVKVLEMEPELGATER